MHQLNTYQQMRLLALHKILCTTLSANIDPSPQADCFSYYYFSWYTHEILFLSISSSKEGIHRHVQIISYAYIPVVLNSTVFLCVYAKHLALTCEFCSIWAKLLSQL